MDVEGLRRRGRLLAEPYRHGRDQTPARPSARILAPRLARRTSPTSVHSGDRRPPRAQPDAPFTAWQQTALAIASILWTEAALSEDVRTDRDDPLSSLDVTVAALTTATPYV